MPNLFVDCCFQAIIPIISNFLHGDGCFLATIPIMVAITPFLVTMVPYVAKKLIDEASFNCPLLDLASWCMRIIEYICLQQNQCFQLLEKNVLLKKEN